jgi:hypothetical protein
VLFVAHDVPMPAPFDALRMTTEPFALALVLTPGQGARGALRLAPEAGAAAPPALAGSLAALHDANPVARALPLLALLAGGGTATIHLPMLDDARLRVDVAP